MVQWFEEEKGEEEKGEEEAQQEQEGGAVELRILNEEWKKEAITLMETRAELDKKEEEQQKDLKNSSIQSIILLIFCLRLQKQKSYKNFIVFFYYYLQTMYVYTFMEIKDLQATTFISIKLRFFLIIYMNLAALFHELGGKIVALVFIIHIPRINILIKYSTKYHNYSISIT